MTSISSVTSLWWRSVFFFFSKTRYSSWKMLMSLYFYSIFFFVSNVGSAGSLSPNDVQLRTSIKLTVIGRFSRRGLLYHKHAEALVPSLAIGYLQVHIIKSWGSGYTYVGMCKECMSWASRVRPIDVYSMNLVPQVWYKVSSTIKLLPEAYIYFHQ